MLKSIWQRVDRWFSGRSAGQLRSARRSQPRNLRFDVLEERTTPAAFTANIVNNTLTISKIAGTGSGDITITNSGDFQKFTLTTTTGNINGSASITTPFPVTGIVVNLGSGNDALTFDGASNGTINLTNGLKITGSGGNKTIISNLMNIVKGNPLNKGGLNISLTGTGSETATFTDTNIQGPTVITHTGSGDTAFSILASNSNAAALNNWGSLTITNGAGADTNIIHDTVFSGTVKIVNGNGSGNNSQYGGSRNIISADKYQTLLTITGGLSIATSTGHSDTQIFDYNVYGAVSVGAGSGANGQSNYVGIENNQNVAGNGIPVFGSVAITGNAAGSAIPGFSIDLGTDTSNDDFYVRIIGALSVTANGSGAANIDLNDLTVGGTTTITLGGSTTNNVVNVHGDDAPTSFAGMIINSTALGTNTFNIQTIKGTADFSGGLSFKLGRGNDAINVGSTDGPVHVRNSLTLSGTGGNKVITARNDTFGGLAFTSTGTGTGGQTARFTDVNVTGAATLSHTITGNTALTIETSSDNVNALNYWTSLAVTNGKGSDVNLITDTAFSAGVTINNGTGAAGNTSQYGGSRNVISADNYTSLLTIGGGVTIATTSGQSDTQLFDYDVHGSVSITTGTGIGGQQFANFVGVSNNQTTTGSGIPVIGGSLTITGNTVSSLTTGLVINVGTDGGSNDYPLIIHNALTVTAKGTGSAKIDLNDLNVSNGATTINLGNATGNNTVSIQGDSVTAVLWNLAINSLAIGNNTFNLQNQAGNLQLTGTVNFKLGNGNDTVNLAATSSGDTSNAVVELYGVSTFNGGAGVDFIWGGTLGTNVFYNIVPIVVNF